VSKRRITVVSAAIVRDGKYLITQRLERAVLPGLWEFPGGRVEEGEPVEVALRRELHYRLGIAAGVGERLAINVQEYSNYTVELHLYRCDLGGREPRPIRVQDMRWVTSAEFDDYAFTPADEHSMDALLFGDS
jgi:8-oxo-dGTP diphosphatase